MEAYFGYFAYFKQELICVSWNADGTRIRSVVHQMDQLLLVISEAENDWWLCKHLKVNTENTITSISWHPKWNRSFGWIY